MHMHMYVNIAMLISHKNSSFAHICICIVIKKVVLKLDECSMHRSNQA